MNPQVENERNQQKLNDLMSKGTGGRGGGGGSQDVRGSMGGGRKASQRGGQQQQGGGEDGWNQVPQRTGRQYDPGRMDSNKLISVANRMDKVMEHFESDL